MPDTVTASAPGKLMLFGEHAVVYGRPCIVTAVDQRMRAKVERIDEPVFKLHAPDVGIDAYSRPVDTLMSSDVPKGARFIEQALSLYRASHPFEGGVSVTTSSDFSPLFGFGSSSASTVAFLTAINALFSTDFDERGLFDLAYKTVLAVQGKGSGFDVASAAWGGTMLYARGGEIAEPFSKRLPALVVGYTGIKADTVSIVNRVAKEAEKDPARVNGIYDAMESIVQRATEAFSGEDWVGMGSLMNENQRLLSDLGVSSDILDTLIAAARSAGALGAKLSGAGVGDCMVALAMPKTAPAVAEAIAQAGGTVLSVSVHAEKSHVES